MSALAWLDLARQLHTRVDGRDNAHTPQFDRSALWGPWAAELAKETSTWSWPVWSPDRRRVAAYRLPAAAGQPTVVQVTDAAGVQAIEPAALGGNLPIYLSWSPRGTQLALLTQDGGRLALEVVRPDRVSTERTEIARGSPLFFNWLDEQAIAAFVGAEDESATMVSLAIDGTTIDFPGEPASFCAPTVLADGRVAYVVRHGDGLRLVAARPGDEAWQDLGDARGLVAIVGSPDGRKIARGIAPQGDGTPYREIAIVDAATGEATIVWQDTCLAFFWTPDGRGLIVARVDTERNLLQWHHLPLGGEPSWLTALQPTRDFGFYLRFFEQFAVSHPIVDKRHLLLAGTPLAREPGRGPPTIRLLDWRTGEVEVVGEGVFGTFAPVARPAAPG